jgi:hypothetical protein
LTQVSSASCNQFQSTDALHTGLPGGVVEAGNANIADDDYFAHSGTNVSVTQPDMINVHLNIILPPVIGDWYVYDGNNSNCNNNPVTDGEPSAGGAESEQLVGRVTLDATSGPADQYCIIYGGNVLGGGVDGGYPGTAGVFSGNGAPLTDISGATTAAAFAAAIDPFFTNWGPGTISGGNAPGSAVVTFDMNELLNQLLANGTVDALDGEYGNIRIAIRNSAFPTVFDVWSPQPNNTLDPNSVNGAGTAVGTDGTVITWALDETDPTTAFVWPPSFVHTSGSGLHWTNNNSSWTFLYFV